MKVVHYKYTFLDVEVDVDVAGGEISATPILDGILQTAVLKYDQISYRLHENVTQLHNERSLCK